MSWIFVFQSLYFFLPAYCANMAPTFAKKAGVLKFLAKPVDSGKKYKGFPIFGHHKTWRGIIFGVLIGTLTAFLQKFLWKFPLFEGLSFLNYQEINVLFLGFLLSLGAMLGDLISSFFKRRRGIEPGESWIPFDQISFVIGAFLLVGPFKEFEIQISAWLIILLLSFFLHIIFNRIGFWLKISDSKI